MQRNIAADPTFQFLILKCVIVIFDLHKVVQRWSEKKSCPAFPLFIKGGKVHLEWSWIL